MHMCTCMCMCVCACVCVCVCVCRSWGEAQRCILRLQNVTFAALQPLLDAVAPTSGSPRSVLSICFSVVRWVAHNPSHYVCAGDSHYVCVSRVTLGVCLCESPAIFVSVCHHRYVFV